MNTVNSNERDLLELLISIKGKSRIQLQLHPHLESAISKKPVNKCLVESSAINGRYHWEHNIREEFYDYLVPLFHNTY